MNNRAIIELINPQTEVLAFRLIELTDDSFFKTLNRFNCYKVILIRKGKGHITYDQVKYEFGANCLIRFPIYQPFTLASKGPIEGVLLQFHPDFFWNHKYDMELTSKQVLFEKIGEIPLLKMDAEEMDQLMHPLDQLVLELTDHNLGHYDITISWVKIFMIYASRIKMKKENIQSKALSESHYIIRRLTSAIERNFHRKHRPADYAKLLNVTVKTLNRIAKKHKEKTVGDMIAERIVAQARHELYASSKTIKQIAIELGFHDVAYFSRFFKLRMGLSPDLYRKSLKENNN